MVSPPSQSFPRLTARTLLSISTAEIISFVGRLESIYRPVSHNRIDALKTDRQGQDSGYSTDDEDEQEDEGGRIFEQTFSKNWLLALLKASVVSGWTEDAIEDGDRYDVELEERVAIIERASRLIAFLSETSASGAIQRIVVLPTNADANDDISITLLDAMPTSADPTGVGLQSWGASIILSRRLALAPASFGLDAEKGGGLRVLELGSGTGLLSLAVAKLVEREAECASDGGETRTEGGGTTIVATDFHPAVLLNLQRNINDNHHSPSITVVPLDWSAIHSLSPDAPLLPALLDERFDIILGGDIIYREFHSLWIRSTVERLLSYPSKSTPSPRFILIAPLRPTHVEAIASITAIFPHIDDLPPQPVSSGQRGWRIAILSIESAEREWGVGRADEAGYRIFTIGWVETFVVGL